MKFSLDSLKTTFSNMKAVTSNRTYAQRYRVGPIRRDYFETEGIEKIINSNNIEDIVNLSRIYFRTNGLYRRIVIYFSTMLLYDTVVVPQLLRSDVDKDKFTKNYLKALNFVEKMNLPQELTRIFTIMLVDGVYYGLVYDTPDGTIIFGDLPRNYCRTRFRSNSGNQILEFDVSYFETFKDGREKKLVFDNFPTPVRQYYEEWREGKHSTPWYLCPEEQGVAFVASIDGSASTKNLPFFVQTIPAISRLKDYEKADLDSVENELSKLVINKIPLDKENELAFELPEIEAVHKGVVDMLSDNPHIDVITTFCDTEVASLGSTVDNVRNDLSTITHLVYNEAGVSKQLFDNDSAISIQYSVQNDLALALALLKPVQHWLSFELNSKFKRSGEYFYEINILPISHYNREEMSNLYLKGAQYGFSKFYAGAALGIKQTDVIALSFVENDVLQLHTKMIPLQSSHTTSGKTSAQSSSNTVTENESGGQEKPTSELSEKTVENKESM